jgi:hypothetical protein
MAPRERRERPGGRQVQQGARALAVGRLGDLRLGRTGRGVLAQDAAALGSTVAGGGGLKTGS